ncbi:MAG: hypothetical protein AB7F35_12205 [Acetobacteraceae bacterium]
MHLSELSAHHRARMAEVREAFNRQGYVYAVSQRAPGYAILLTCSTIAGEFNVHSFRDGQPVGHRDYDRLEGGGPTQNAFQEFAGADFLLLSKPGIPICQL